MSRFFTVLAAALLFGCNSDDTAPGEPPLSGPVVFIGDSIIANWSELAELVPESINAGVGGHITAWMLGRFDEDVLSHHPAVVVIEGGVNDFFNEDNPDARNLAEMAVRASAAGARVLLMSILPAQIPYNIHAFNFDIRTVAAAHGYTYVDYDPVMHVGGQPRWELLQDDGVHPNGDGYAAMWSVLKPALARNGVITN